jgi:hypothetical protein
MSDKPDQNDKPVKPNEDPAPDATVVPATQTETTTTHTDTTTETVKPA